MYHCHVAITVQYRTNFALETTSLWYIVSPLLYVRTATTMTFRTWKLKNRTSSKITLQIVPSHSLFPKKNVNAPRLSEHPPVFDSLEMSLFSRVFVYHCHVAITVQYRTNFALGTTSLWYIVYSLLHVRTATTMTIKLNLNRKL